MGNWGSNPYKWKYNRTYNLLGAHFVWVYEYLIRNVFSVDLMTCRESEFESLKSTVSVIPKGSGMALLRQESWEAFMHLSFVVRKCHEKPERAIETGNDRAK